MDGYRKLFSTLVGSSGLTMTSASLSPYSPSTVTSTSAPTTYRLLLLLFFIIVAQVSLQAHERTLSKQETFIRRRHRQWIADKPIFPFPHRTDELNQGQGAQHSMMETFSKRCRRQWNCGQTHLPIFPAKVEVLEHRFSLVMVMTPSWLVSKTSKMRQRRKELRLEQWRRKAWDGGEWRGSKRERKREERREIEGQNFRIWHFLCVDDG